MAFFASYVAVVCQEAVVGLAPDAVFEAEDNEDAVIKLKLAGYTSLMFNQISKDEFWRFSKSLGLPRELRHDIKITKKKGVQTRTYKPHTPKYVKNARW